MGVAVRRYYTSPRTHDDYLESWLELWDGPPGADDAKLLPGYGWIFGMGDGTVERRPGRAQLQRRLPEDRLPRAADDAGWTTPRRSGACARRTRPARRAARPCRWASTARRTTATALLLVGDSGGSVNPFNGEGIPYAMESGKFAAEAVVQALARPAGPAARARAGRLPGRDGRRSGAPTTASAACS